MVLESRRRFSQSLLWRLQRRFYEEHGPQAWITGKVPSYVTSNPFIARAYATVAAAYLTDWQRELDPREPVYLVELGAGPGRFSHTFLTHFLPLVRAAGLGSPVVYVMTDLAERNLAAWRAHPQLKPWLDAGVLDFARMDAGTDRTLQLERSGRRLAPGEQHNPLVAIANYCFDSLPLDVFEVHDGQLFESLVTVETDGGGPDDPGVLEKVRLAWQLAPVADPAAYYQDAAWGRILAEYARLPTASLRMPTGALHTCGALRDLAGGRLLVLTADKGFHETRTMTGMGAPALALHGSFSVDLNYHALGAYLGELVTPPQLHQHIRVCALLSGVQAVPLARAAFAAEVARFGPDDYFGLKQVLERRIDDLEVHEAVAWLRLSDWDPRSFVQVLPRFERAAPLLPPRARAEVLRIVREVWARYFDIGEEERLASRMAGLAVDYGDHREALHHLAHARELEGEHADIDFNIAFCHRELGELDAARAAAERLLAREPDHQGARELLAALAAPP